MGRKSNARQKSLLLLSSRASLIKYRFVRERGNDKSDTCMRDGC